MLRGFFPHCTNRSKFALTVKMNIVRQYFLINCNYLVKSIYRPLTTSSYLQSYTSRSDASASDRIVWVDLEMTGLNFDKDHILEIACLVTDAELNVIGKGPNVIVHQPDGILQGMDEWCRIQHGETGLTEASKKSKISLTVAEQMVVHFVLAHVPEKRCPLAGNSVYIDRLFLRKHMPSFEKYLHYRMIDVSTLKELARRWHPKEFSRIPQKQFTHRALDDILESIEELKYYRKRIFKKSQSDVDK